VLNNATREYRQGVGNVPGTFYQTVWRTPEQKAITRAAIGKDRMPGFENFMRILNHARKGLPEGSPTATDTGVMAPDVFSKSLKGALKAVNVNTWMNPGDAVSAGTTALRQPGARIRLMERLMDPDGVKMLRKLRMLSPLGSRAVKLVSDFMFRSGVLTVEEGLNRVFGEETRGAPLDPKFKGGVNPPLQSEE